MICSLGAPGLLVCGVGGGALFVFCWFFWTSPCDGPGMAETWDSGRVSSAPAVFPETRSGQVVPQRQATHRLYRCPQGGVALKGGWRLFMLSLFSYVKTYF